MTESPQRWAIIGTGTISHAITADLARCSGAETVMVHSRDAGDPAQLTVTHGFDEFTMPHRVSHFP